MIAKLVSFALQQRFLIIVGSLALMIVSKQKAGAVPWRRNSASAQEQQSMRVYHQEAGR